jgi:hypothetical protein
MSAFVTFALLTSTAIAVEEQPPTVASIESRFLQERRKIQSGKVELQSVSTDYANGEPKPVLNTRRIIWFDGDKIRSDAWWPYSHPRHLRVGEKTPAPSPKSVKEYRETVCLANGRLISWSDVKLSGNGSLRVELVIDPKHLPPRDLQYIYHPRLLGTSLADSFNQAHFGLESLIGMADRSPPSLARAKLNGMDCWRIEYTGHNGLTIRAWYAADHGDSLVRLEGLTQDKKMESSIDCAVARVAGTDIWFPTQLSFQQKYEGKFLRKETVDIKISDWNKPVSDRIFSPQDMAIPPGTTVARTPSDPRGTLIWDGQDFVPITRSAIRRTDNGQP